MEHLEKSPRLLRLLWACVLVAATHVVLSGLAALRWW